jgi:hypothetical protein
MAAGNATSATPPGTTSGAMPRAIPPSALTPRKSGNMLFYMKTTVDLPDDLFIAAKKRAVELRQPLRALIERGLRAELGRSTGHRPTKPRTIRWVTVAGGLPAGVDVSDRAAMHEWLRQQR